MTATTTTGLGTTGRILGMGTSTDGRALAQRLDHRGQDLVPKGLQGLLDLSRTRGIRRERHLGPRRRGRGLRRNRGPRRTRDRARNGGLRGPDPTRGRRTPAWYTCHTESTTCHGTLGPTATANGGNTGRVRRHAVAPPTRRGRVHGVGRRQSTQERGTSREQRDPKEQTLQRNGKGRPDTGEEGKWPSPAAPP